MIQKKEQTTTTNTEQDDHDVGHGELYSPDHANKIRAAEVGEGMMKVVDIRRNLGVIKERVLEKLAAAAVPVDALENARHLLESVVRDVTVAAHGLTMDALQRIKNLLVDILPSLSPAIATKMVDDAEKEARESDAEDEEDDRKLNRESPLPPSRL
ncbi:hypothetical protein SLEP1_g36072 [Rubroshorea leprosula]|uniref:Uncharacterized protein n=1 Tax=Rubroshorea leprosula TaxID=152421 RepID=A0AAV5KQA7_9ROSI|nr:hypothetical protein SLEP1_g36072 [Rubroshorea leprosula]